MSFKSFSTAQTVLTKEQSEKENKGATAKDQPDPKAEKDSVIIIPPSKS